MNNPLISVIIPVYNVAKYLPRCLDSVCQQTYSNLEIILVDDGSTDNSLEICNQYAKQDKRIVVIHQGNKGVSAARNAGLKIAKGELLSFVDADDWIEPQGYQFLVTLYNETKADLIWAQMRPVFPGRSNKQEICVQSATFQELTIEDFLTLIAKNKDFFLWNKLFRRRDDITPFPIEQTLAEDSAFVFEYIRKAPKIIKTSFTFYNYYQRSNSAVHTLSVQARYQAFSTWKKCYKFCISQQFHKAAQAILPITLGTASLLILTTILQTPDSSSLKEPYLWLKRYYKSLGQNNYMGQYGILFSKLFIRFPKIISFCCRLPGIAGLLTYILRKRIATISL